MFKIKQNMKSQKYVNLDILFNSRYVNIVKLQCVF